MVMTAHPTLNWQTQHDVQQLHLRYAQVLDANDFSAWPDLFTPDCLYTLQSRENFDAGLPLCILRLESQAMLQDRVCGAMKTIYHAPYYQRHIVSTPLIDVDPHTGLLHANTNYLVLRTHRDALPEILSTGRYIDLMVYTANGLRFQQRQCIFDNDLIANSLIKPI